MLEKRASDRPGAVEVRDRLAALDPDPARARARAREDGYLGPRASRMVDLPPANPAANPAANLSPSRGTWEGAGGRGTQSPASLELAIVGTIDADLLIGLGANGITAFRVSDEEPIGDDTAAIFVVDADEPSIAANAKLRPVIAGITSADVARLSSFMRAGASDVAARPFTAAELAKKIRRIARDRARRK
jgi:hypothetical protein